MKHPSPALAVAIAATIVSVSAHAQFAPPSPNQKDLPVDAKTRAAVIDTLVQALNDRYVFPEVAKKLEREFRALQKRGAFDGLSSSQAFADSLSSVLLAVGKDRHFRVGYREVPIPRVAERREPPPEERQRMLERARRLNYGFDRAQRLAGNIGYLEIRSFEYGGAAAGDALAAAMRFLGNTDALIVDVRRNGGGSPEVVQLVTTYLMEDGDRVHLNDLVHREGGSERVDSYFTLPWVPGPRFDGKDIYVLTSRGTGSAAEEFTYNLKNLKRATIVGDTTGGAANPGGFVRLSDHFAAFISTGRARNPISKTNWEGVGVIPDVAIAPGEALRTAHVAALEKLLAQATDDERKSSLEMALTVAKETAPEKWEEPRRRRVAR